MSDWKTKLKEAKEMLDMGLLEQDEFDALKAELKQKALKALRGEGTVPYTSITGLSGETAIDSSNENVLPAEQANLLSGSTVVNTSYPDEVSSGAELQKIGDYHILSELGVGGMGRVLRGRHSIAGLAEREGDVAIKLMHDSLSSDETFKNRFIQEASLGKTINHPNIAKVHHVYSDPLALVLSYIDGEELKALIPSDGLSLEKTIQFVRPIAEALDHLHANGIIHRDIKPANIKVSLSGVPMLLDFGIAKDTSSVSGMTKTSMAMGTEAYMAPEQMNAKHAGPEADQYALAMTIYECLSGSLPWADDETSAQVVMRKMMSDFVPLSERRGDLPAHVEKVLLRGLSVKAEQRFESCVAFINALNGNQSSSHANISIYKQAVSKVLEDSRSTDWEREQLDVLQAELGLSDLEIERVWLEFKPQENIDLRIILNEKNFFNAFSVGSESAIHFKVQNQSNKHYERFVCHVQLVQGGGYLSGAEVCLRANSDLDYQIDADLIPYAEYVVRLLICTEDWLGRTAYYYSVGIPHGLFRDGFKSYWSESLLDKIDAHNWRCGLYSISEEEYKRSIAARVDYSQAYQAAIHEYNEAIKEQQRIELENKIRQEEALKAIQKAKEQEALKKEKFAAQNNLELFKTLLLNKRQIKEALDSVQERHQTYLSLSSEIEEIERSISELSQAIEEAEGSFFSFVTSSRLSKLKEDKEGFMKKKDLYERLHPQSVALSIKYSELSAAFSQAEQDYDGFFDSLSLNAKKVLVQCEEEKFGTNGIFIPEGQFFMGGMPNQQSARKDEYPRRNITISQSLVAMKFPVTQKLYHQIRALNKSFQIPYNSRFEGENNPADSVSWYDAVKFANLLSQYCDLEMVYTRDKDKVICDFTKNGWRLPTEAEWEYLARGGDYHLFSGANDIDEVAWYSENSQSQTHPVGQKKPNGFGLYDMCGNVWEWCWDWYGDYNNDINIDPQGPRDGTHKVYRGGCFFAGKDYTRISIRSGTSPSNDDRILGFRLVRSFG